MAFADAARKLGISKDRLYGLCEGLGIHPMQTTGGQSGSRGGKPPVLLMVSQVKVIASRRLQYRREAGKV